MIFASSIVTSEIFCCIVHGHDLVRLDASLHVRATCGYGPFRGGDLGMHVESCMLGDLFTFVQTVYVQLERCRQHGSLRGPACRSCEPIFMHEVLETSFSRTVVPGLC